MGLTKLDKIVESLDAKRWSKQTPVMVISKGTCPREKIVSGTLADIQQRIKENPLEPPVLIVVGETLKFYHENSGAFTDETHPLHRHRPEAVPRVRRGDPFPDDRNHAGEADAGRIKTLLTDLVNYDIILFTSKFGVKYFFELLAREGYAVKNLTQKNICRHRTGNGQGVSARRCSCFTHRPGRNKRGTFSRDDGETGTARQKNSVPALGAAEPVLKTKIDRAGRPGGRINRLRQHAAGETPAAATGGNDRPGCLYQPFDGA